MEDWNRILEKLKEKGFVCYRSKCGQERRDSITAGPVQKIIKGKSYFIVPLVGDGTDSREIERFIQGNHIQEPQIRIIESDRFKDLANAALSFNLFTITNNRVEVLTKIKFLDRTFDQFLEIIDAIPALPK